MEYYGHGVLDSYCVDGFECWFYGLFRYLEVGLEDIHRGMCVDARAPAVITMRGFTVHPWVIRSVMRGWYFSSFLVIVSGENRSLQYVNSMNWMRRLESGSVGGGAWYGNP